MPDKEGAVFRHRLEIAVRPGLRDSLAQQTQEKLRQWLDMHPRRVVTRKAFVLEMDLAQHERDAIERALVDPVAEVGGFVVLDEPDPDAIFVTVGYRPGVTDAVGRTVARAVADCLGRMPDGHTHSQLVYGFWGLAPEQVKRAANELLHNPLIEYARLEVGTRTDNEAVRATVDTPPVVQTIPLCTASDDELVALSKRGMLALSLVEMRVIAEHFRAMGRDPTDAELECLAQTWSEHCKHKIFASPIRYRDPDGHESLVPGLFRTYIRGATEAVAAARLRQNPQEHDQPFLISVFHDNAGVVRFTEQDHLVYKVETHNSPSALDPYGGAMTGIVGVNRDSFGTGLGAELLTNVWGYCFGDPNAASVPAGLMHPRRIRDGVHRGVTDGGNHSGIPYSRGWELFDERFTGKPLVFCGTVAVMPALSAGHPTDRKRARVGDKIVMVGGRIGKDGIHGATFSSLQLDEDAPTQAVQIGDPLIQKMMFDALTEARELGLYSSMTDNGAGGLSSSVGEMALATGGAVMDLACAPLKYPGLQPWEILVSEAQERMTVAVPPATLDGFLALCRLREVEASVLGEFTSDGRLRVMHGDMLVADLDLDFLHDGVPLPELEATWDSTRTASRENSNLVGAGDVDLATLLLDLLGSEAHRSLEPWGRHYDHEVKGLSVVKPFVGVDQNVPATATVMRVRHSRKQGVVLAEGVHPFYGDHDTHAMALACVDEGVRRVLCAGARTDRISALDNFCWPDPIRSSTTPDGAHKLAQLVRCCEGLHLACTTYGVPLISGKDSMKNDAVLGGRKISIPPTLLVSVMAQIEDVSQSLTLQPRRDGQVVYLLGSTENELGGSVFARWLGMEAARVPRTDVGAAWQRYLAFADVRDRGLVHCAHALGRGGLAFALAHMQIGAGSELSMTIDLDALHDDLPASTSMFSESTGRIVFCAAETHAEMVEAELKRHGLRRIGTVDQSTGGRARLVVRKGGSSVIDVQFEQLRSHFAGAPR